MKSLDDAWAWYTQSRTLLLLCRRLGARYWSGLDWDGPLGRDETFKKLEAFQIKDMADLVLTESDDLAVFVFFSVFESVVRQIVAADLESEVAGLQHPALQRSAQLLLQNVEEGSFYLNVLSLFKRDGRVPANLATNSLIEEINRIRRYRNWVAHGRKHKERPNLIEPKDAYDTLQALTHIGQLDESA